MSFAVALGGKGGTGKTTIAGLLIQYMLDHGMKPLLAIDADSNSNLNEVLGVPLEETLSDAREDMKTKVPTGMTKDIYMEMKVEQALIEAEGFDLIAMGRPEGPGCYCAANNLLTTLIERLIGNYQYIVIDNEAGMEHFSRLTQKDIDLLVLVSDPSRRGLSAACRIAELVKTLPIRVSRSVLVVNQVRQEPANWPDEVQRLFGKDGIACLPADPLISQFDMEGKPTVKLPDDAPVVKAAKELFEKLLNGV
ncbi:MAG: AAA family ATPase [Deltaproteobacteria bacterium]|nr:AAA family ATPase [Deltaproteobacteria bacterium]MDA8307561.1 AAA family ATPase [Deltaproteobacteria bacterium]